MSAIKLFKTDDIGGVIRLQSQLAVGTKVADFIIRDGILYHWGFGINGTNWYPYNEPYQIVTDIKEMKYQEL